MSCRVSRVFGLGFRVSGLRVKGLRVLGLGLSGLNNRGSIRLKGLGLQGPCRTLQWFSMVQGSSGQGVGLRVRNELMLSRCTIRRGVQ